LKRRNVLKNISFNKFKKFLLKLVLKYKKTVLKKFSVKIQKKTVLKILASKILVLKFLKIVVKNIGVKNCKKFLKILKINKKLLKNISVKIIPRKNGDPFTSKSFLRQYFSMIKNSFKKKLEKKNCYAQFFSVKILNKIFL